MARNIEIKARIDSIESLLPKVASLADQDPMVILQDDIFFSCPNGRLKLRILSPSEGQLIFYKRPDQSGPKESFYLISPTEDPESLRETLSEAYGQIGRVRKNRILFLTGRTRIHLDKVEGLGHFLELEVVLESKEMPEDGVVIAHDLLSKLEISSDQLIQGAYVDLINATHPSKTL